MSKQTGSAPDAASAPDSRVTPIVEEQAVILKRKTLTEGVRVRTVVHEDEAVIDEPITSETIEVERVPLVNRRGRRALLYSAGFGQALQAQSSPG